MTRLKNTLKIKVNPHSLSGLKAWTFSEDDYKKIKYRSFFKRFKKRRVKVNNYIKNKGILVGKFDEDDLRNKRDKIQVE